MRVMEMTGMVGMIAIAEPHTFWEQAAVAGLGIPAQEPAVAKVVVALDQLNPVATAKAQLVGAPGDELMHDDEAIAGPAAFGVRALSHAAGAGGRRGRERGSRGGGGGGRGREEEMVEVEDEACKRWRQRRRLWLRVR